MPIASADTLAAAGGLVGALLDVALLRLRCSLLGRPPRFGLGALITSPCLGRSTRTELLAAAFVDGLGRELRLTPKPGLVDLRDAGSHPDLTLATMRRSIGLVAVYLGELCRSERRGEGLARQVAIARVAEARMLARLGTNTHKGAIFLGGLFVVGASRAGSDDERAVRRGISSLARELAAAAPPRGTNGEAARREHGVRGILGEAAAGLPSLFEAGLGAFRRAAAAGADERTASFAMLAALMQTVEDTTALHRCGRAGLELVRADGARLERLVARGAHVPFLEERNAAYRRMGLTMGGVADLLGAGLGWLVYRGELGLPEA